MITESFVDEGLMLIYAKHLEQSLLCQHSSVFHIHYLHSHNSPGDKKNHHSHFMKERVELFG